MADYELTDQPEAMVFGVDADGVSYVLQPGGAFSVATEDFNVVLVRACQPSMPNFQTCKGKSFHCDSTPIYVGRPVKYLL